MFSRMIRETSRVMLLALFGGQLSSLCSVGEGTYKSSRAGTLRPPPTRQDKLETELA